jgi:hypothetical protein
MPMQLFDSGITVRSISLRAIQFTPTNDMDLVIKPVET